MLYEENSLMIQRSYKMSDPHEELFVAMNDVERMVIRKLNTLIDAKWDSETMRKEIEMLILEHRQIADDFDSI